MGGCPLAGGSYRDWSRAEVIETEPGVFEVALELRSATGPPVPIVFVVGPGTAADGGTSDLIALDVRPGTGAS